MLDIVTALSSSGLPVSHPPYLGDAEQYVTFYLLDHGHSNWASGGAVEDVTVYSVDLFSRGDDLSTSNQLLTLLRAAGYVVREGPEFYESDTGLYHLNFDVRGWTDLWET